MRGSDKVAVANAALHETLAVLTPEIPDTEKHCPEPPPADPPPPAED